LTDKLKANARAYSINKVTPLKALIYCVLIFSSPKLQVFSILPNLKICFAFGPLIYSFIPMLFWRQHHVPMVPGIVCRSLLALMLF